MGIDTLKTQLTTAIAAENYELAAKIKKHIEAAEKSNSISVSADTDIVQACRDAYKDVNPVIRPYTGELGESKVHGIYVADAKGNIVSETGSVCRAGFTPLTPNMMVEAVEIAIDTIPQLKGAKAKFRNGETGYDIELIGERVEIGGDSLNWMTTLSANFDTTKRANCAAGLWRMICTNGLVDLIDAVNFRRKQTSKFSDSWGEYLAQIPTIGQKFDELVPKIENAQQTIVDIDTFISKTMGDKDSTQAKRWREEVKSTIKTESGDSHKTNLWIAANAVQGHFQHGGRAGNSVLDTASWSFERKEVKDAFKLALVG